MMTGGWHLWPATYTNKSSLLPPVGSLLWTWLTRTASSRPDMTISRTRSRGKAGMASSLMLFTSFLMKIKKLFYTRIVWDRNSVDLNNGHARYSGHRHLCDIQITCHNKFKSIHFWLKSKIPFSLIKNFYTKIYTKILIFWTMPQKLSKVHPLWHVPNVKSKNIVNC